jgi:hypothetical protein
MTPESHPEKETGLLNKRLVFLLIGIIIIVRISFVFLLPFGQKTSHHLEGLNDEPAHYNYVKYLAVHHSFPVLTHWVFDKDAFTRNEFEYHQAPLYYCLCVPLYWMFGDKGALMPSRLLCMIFGILSLWILVLIVRDLGYPKKVQAGAVFFAGFLFSHLYFSSVVSNDSLSWLLALLLTRELLRYVRADGTGIRKLVPLSIALSTLYCAAGLLTKSSFLIFLPVIFGAGAYRFLRSKKTVCIAHAFIGSVVPCILAFPWYFRNILLYHSITGMPAPEASIPFSFPTLVGFIKGTIKYLWFPMQNLEGGTAVFAVLTFCGGALVAVHCAIALFWLVQKRNRNAGTILVAILFIINAGATFWYYLQWQNPEARFLFPALGTIVLFMVVPVYKVFERLKVEKLFMTYVFLLGIFPYPFLFFVK